MIGRRTFLALGLAGVAGVAAWRIDVPPRAIADERDVALLDAAVEDQRRVLAAGLAASLPLERLELVRAQVQVLGGEVTDVVASAAPAGWGEFVAAAAGRRAGQAQQARAQDLVETLAAVAAGLRQLAIAAEVGR